MICVLALDLSPFLAHLRHQLKEHSLIFVFQSFFFFLLLWNFHYFNSLDRYLEMRFIFHISWKLILLTWVGLFCRSFLQTEANSTNLILLVINIFTINKSSNLPGDRYWQHSDSRAASQTAWTEKRKHNRASKMEAFWDRKTFVPCKQKISVGQYWCCGQYINKSTKIIIKLQLF